MPGDYGGALIALTGALIGSATGTITTIYVTYKQTRDHFNKEVWAARRIAYGKITVAIQDALVKTVKLQDVLRSEGAQYLEIPDGEEYWTLVQTGLDTIRATFDESIVFLPLALISKGEDFRKRLVLLSKASLKHQDVAELLIINTIQALSQLRSDVITIAREELLGEHVQKPQPPKAPTSTAP